MEIRIYTPELNLVGIIENQTSLIWTRRFNECGEFELYLPITESNMKYIQLENLVYVSGFDEAGVIEYIIHEENKNHNQITVKGRFLTSYLDRRLIKSTFTFNGKTEVAMRRIFLEATEIPRVIMGEINDYDERVEFQATYKNLLDYEEKLAKSANFGFRFRPDFNNKVIVFEIYKGINRTASQGVINRVIFSMQYENLNEAQRTINNQVYKNVAFVGGEGEGEEREFVQVGYASGLELREGFVDARDARKEEGMSDNEYRNILIQRGNSFLEENKTFDSFECKTEANTNFVYRKNYDLGDIVTVRKKDWNYTKDLRITEIQEVYEYGGMKVVPTFGDPIPTTIKWEE